MISIPRSLCRDFHALLRKHGVGRPSTCPPVELATGQSGLTIRWSGPDVAVQVRRPGRHAGQKLLVPLAALAECEGRDDTSVAFRPARRGGIEAAWKQDGQLKSREYPVPVVSTSTFPTPPARLAPCTRELLTALDAAGQVTDRGSSTRYSLSCIQLRGGAGEIVASDSKQLLLQRGFAFPWTGDALVPVSGLFAALATMTTGPVSIGRSPSHVWIEAGKWSVALKIDAAGKFPDAQTLIARTSKPEAELILDPVDRNLLLRTLPKLPGHKDDHRPVTLDLDRRVVVRARGETDKRSEELVLSHSRMTGKPVRVACDRTYLLAALKFGFGGISILSPDKPIVCRDRTRIYLFMSLSGDAIETSAKSSAAKPEKLVKASKPQKQPMPKVSKAPQPQTSVSKSNRIPSHRPATPTPKPPPSQPSANRPKSRSTTIDSQAVQRVVNNRAVRRGVWSGLIGRIRGLFGSARR